MAVFLVRRSEIKKVFIIQSSKSKLVGNKMSKKKWNIIKEIIDRADPETFRVLYSSFHHFGSQDFVLTCRQIYPNDEFWTISNEFTREKRNWLQD